MKLYEQVSLTPTSKIVSTNVDVIVTGTLSTDNVPKLPSLPPPQSILLTNPNDGSSHEYTAPASKEYVNTSNVTVYGDDIKLTSGTGSASVEIVSLTPSAGTVRAFDKPPADGPLVDFSVPNTVSTIHAEITAFGLTSIDPPSVTSQANEPFSYNSFVWVDVGSAADEDSDCPTSSGHYDPGDDFTLTSGNGSRMDPVYKKIKEHGGVDYGAPRGTDVLAATDGEVVYSGRNTGKNGQLNLGFGNTVIIQSTGANGNDYFTIYGHLTGDDLPALGEVTAGETIGHVGSTGASTGPHLHFGVLKGDAPVNISDHGGKLGFDPVDYAVNPLKFANWNTDCDNMQDAVTSFHSNFDTV